MKKIYLTKAISLTALTFLLSGCTNVVSSVNSVLDTYSKNETKNASIQEGDSIEFFENENNKSKYNMIVSLRNLTSRANASNENDIVFYDDIFNCKENGFTNKVNPEDYKIASPGQIKSYTNENGVVCTEIDAKSLGAPVSGNSNIVMFTKKD